MKHKQLQQGDVLLTRVQALPAGIANKIQRGKRGLVIAEGEVTGHMHLVEGKDAELVEIGGRMLLKLERAAVIVHEEHKPIRIPPGIWEVGRVQEYDYLAQMARPVAD